MTVEEHLELAFRAAYHRGFHDGKQDAFMDADEWWQKYKLIHFGTDKMSWSFSDHLKADDQSC